MRLRSRIATLLDRRPAVERVPELQAAWTRVRTLERILTAVQANHAQQLVRDTGRRNEPR